MVYKIGTTNDKFSVFAEQYRKSIPDAHLILHLEIPDANDLYLQILLKFANSRIVNEDETLSEWIKFEIYELISFIFNRRNLSNEKIETLESEISRIKLCSSQILNMNIDINNSEKEKEKRKRKRKKKKKKN